MRRGCAGLQWDYVFDWTVLKYQQAQINRLPLDTSQVQAGVATAAGIPPRRTTAAEEAERSGGAAATSQAQQFRSAADSSKAGAAHRSGSLLTPPFVMQ